MRAFSGRAAGVAGVFLCAMWLVAAPSLPAQVVVKVTDLDTEEPVFLAEVRFVPFAGGSHVARANTDGLGRVTFDGLRPGVYTVEAVHGNYELGSERIDYTGVMYNVFIRLKRRADRPRQPAPTGTAAATSLAAPPAAQKEVENGKALLRTDTAKSIAHFQKAIEIFPRYAEAHALLGFAYLREKRNLEAADALNKAIEIDPRLVLARTLRARMLLEGRQFTRAEEDLKEVVRLDPAAWDGHYELARCYFAQNKLALALDHAQRAHDLPQAPSTTHLLLHDIFMKQGNREGALKELEEFVAADPNSAFIPRVKQKIEELRKKP